MIMNNGVDTEGNGQRLTPHSELKKNNYFCLFDSKLELTILARHYK